MEIIMIETPTARRRRYTLRRRRDAPRHLRRRRRDAPRHLRRRRQDAVGTPANTPNFSSRHRYARGLKTTVRILPPLRGSVMIIVLSVGYASLTHGWGPVAPTGLKLGVLARRRRYSFQRERRKSRLSRISQRKSSSWMMSSLLLDQHHSRIHAKRVAAM